jgi:hypothetical protein
MSSNGAEITTLTARKRHRNVEKTGIFKDEMEKNMMKTFNPAGLLQAPPPCF